MLIRFFKSSFLVQYLGLVMVTAALWAPGFMMHAEPPAVPQLIAPLYGLVYPFLALHPLVSPIVAVTIVFSTALTLTNILIYHDLAPKNNILPAFLFILMMGSNPLTLQTYPVILTLPLFTWFLHTTFKINDEPDNIILGFNASLLISVISLVYPGALFLFPVTWIYFLISGTMGGRNLVISFLGFLLPYVYLGVYYFWKDLAMDALEAYRDYFARLPGFRSDSGYLQYAIWGTWFLLMLAPASYRTLSTISSSSISFRRKMSATAWLLAFTMPLILLPGNADFHTLLFLPAGIMIAHFYNLYKKPVFHEIVLSVWLLLILMHHYLNSNAQAVFL